MTYLERTEESVNEVCAGARRAIAGDRGGLAVAETIRRSGTQVMLRPLRKLHFIDFRRTVLGNATEA